MVGNLERTLFVICNFKKKVLKLRLLRLGQKQVLKVLKLRLLRPQSSLEVKTFKIILGIF